MNNILIVLALLGVFGGKATTTAPSIKIQGEIVAVQPIHATRVNIVYETSGEKHDYSLDISSDAKDQNGCIVSAQDYLGTHPIKKFGTVCGKK